MSKSGQKFIAKNRAPRVQIEYEVEVNGAEVKVVLPFVTGVMSDLSGQSTKPRLPLEQRRFLQVDIDNFSQLMTSIAPRATFPVPNVLTNTDHLPVDIRFDSMDDFSPAAVARKVPALRRLLEDRERLQHLKTLMDGRAEGEQLLQRLLNNRLLLGEVAQATPVVPAPADADDFE